MVESEEKSSLDALDSRIKKAKEKHEEKDNAPKNLASPTRVGLELVSGIAVGTVLGIYADKWLETSPLFLIIFFFLGVAAGSLNIYRLIKAPSAPLEKDSE